MKLQWVRVRPIVVALQAVIQPRTDVDELPTHPAFYFRYGMGFCIKEPVDKQFTLLPVHPTTTALQAVEQYPQPKLKIAELNWNILYKHAPSTANFKL